MRPDPQKTAPPRVNGVAEEHGERVAEVYDRHYKALRRKLLRIAPRDVAEEVLSHAFEKVLSQPLPAVRDVQAYLYRTANNLLSNHYRDRRVHQDKLQLLVAEETATCDSLESETLEEERQNLLIKVIDGLPPRCQMALRLRLWEGVPNKEIVVWFAQRGIEISERTVLRYIEHAYEICRQALVAWEDPTQESSE